MLFAAASRMFCLLLLTVTSISEDDDYEYYDYSTGMFIISCGHVISISNLNLKSRIVNVSVAFTFRYF